MDTAIKAHAKPHKWRVLAAALTAALVFCAVGAFAPSQSMQRAEASTLKAPKVASVKVSGDPNSATVKVKLKKVKIKKTKRTKLGAKVKIATSNGKTYTAKVNGKKTATFKHITVGEGGRVTAKARKWNEYSYSKWSGVEKSKWSAPKKSKRAKVLKPEKVYLSNPCAVDTSTAQVTLQEANRATSYQVQISTNGAFNAPRTVTFDEAGTVTLGGWEGVINYVRARAVRTVNGKSACSAWSAAAECNLTQHAHNFSEPAYETTHHKARYEYRYVCISCGRVDTSYDAARTHLLHTASGSETGNIVQTTFRTVAVAVPAYDVTRVVGSRCSTCGLVEPVRGESSVCKHESSCSEFVGYASSPFLRYAVGEKGVEGVDYDLYILPSLQGVALPIGQRCDACGELVTVYNETTAPEPFWASAPGGLPPSLESADWPTAGKFLEDASLSGAHSHSYSIPVSGTVIEAYDSLLTVCVACHYSCAGVVAFAAHDCGGGGSTTSDDDLFESIPSTSGVIAFRCASCDAVEYVEGEVSPRDFVNG